MTQYLEVLFSAYPIHLSVTNLAEVLGVTQKTAYDYLQSGEIPAYRIGSRWVILRDEVRDFLAESSIFTPKQSVKDGLRNNGQLV